MLTISEKQFINTTGQALGVNQKNDDITNNLSSIHKMIKNISNVVETMTFNNGASLSVTGKYKNSYSNGHLILNPKGIDLRFLPGKIKSVDIQTTKGTDDNYRHNITFKNKERPVQKTTFFSDKMIQNNDVKNYPINQQPGKLMDIDTTKSTEELWRSLTDVHHFYPMLEQKGISFDS